MLSPWLMPLFDASLIYYAILRDDAISTHYVTMFVTPSATPPITLFAMATMAGFHFHFIRADIISLMRCFSITTFSLRSLLARSRPCQLR